MKRMVALSLVLLLSIESFAAVVSDNDGSAFITKAEFDSLKNNFQSQVDQYNTSIDSKIDGAIASYLAGININKETFYKVEVADWGEILATNFTLKQTWQFPSVNLSFSFSYADPDINGNWYEVWWATAKINYKKPQSRYQVRNVVEAGAQVATLPDKVVWSGQACDYSDNISAVKAGRCHTIYGRSATGQAVYEYSYLWGATGGSPEMCTVNNFNFTPGYMLGKSVNEIWKAGAWWRQSSGSTTYSYALQPTQENEWVNQNIQTSVVLNYVDGKQYTNQHIISWDNMDWNYLSDPDWCDTLGTSEVFTENEMLNNTEVTKTGRWAVFELNHNGRGNTWENASTSGSGVYAVKNKIFNGWYSGDYATSRTNKIVSVGLLDKTYTSQNILQWSGNRKISRDENEAVSPVNLYNGALIAYAKMDEIFKWEPKITGTYNNGTTDVPITSWKVKLSKAPFGVKDTLQVATDVIKSKGQIEDYLVTNLSGTCKFEVEIDEDTTIFCKWWPDDDNIRDNYDWQGTLDLTQCGTYSITK